MLAPAPAATALFSWPDHADDSEIPSPYFSDRPLGGDQGYRWRSMRTLWALIALGAMVLGPQATKADAAEPTGARTVAVTWTDAGSVALPEDDEIGSKAPWNLSNELTGRFTMAGLLWDSGELEHLFVQVRREDSGWDPWVEVPVSADHSDDSSQERPGSDPVYTGTAIAARFAAVGAVEGTEAMLIDTEALAGESGPTASSLQSVVPAPAAWWQGPDFVRDREEWDTTNCRRPGEGYHFSTPRALVIHHTAGNNTYTEAEVPGVITGHCIFHVQGRGWDDLAYNYMVDRFGNVWEGRTGSKTAAIRGGHTAGFNGQTQGIAMMGNFTSAPPTAANIGGVQQIVDWLTGWHSIDPSTSVTLYADAGNTRGWEIGEPVRVPTIIGHRDVSATSCPGGAFYAMLPSLRASTSPENFGFDPAAIRCAGRVPTIYGTLGHDQIRGTPGPDVIAGLAGNDLIYGFGENDFICGGVGNDHLFGSAGLDNVVGQSGTDNCGGEGRDCEILANSEMFFYRHDGLFRYYDIRDNGTLPLSLFAGSGYTRDWTAITAIDLDGDGQDEMFFYRDDGLFRYYDVRPNGSIGDPILAGSGYTRGWTSITAVDLDGDRQDEIFFYRDDGLFRYYDIAPNGSIGQPIQSGNGYTTGWSAITAIDLDGDLRDEMFFYRDDGLFRYYDVRSNGSLPLPLQAGDGYTRNWTSITAVDLDGDLQDEMFFYREDGLYRYYQIGETAHLPRPILAGDRYTRGWTAITAVDIDHIPYVTPSG